MSVEPDDLDDDGPVGEQFEPIRKVGSGYYGIVWEVKDRETRESFAIKKIRKAFQTAEDAKRAYREVLYLRALQHTNVVTLMDVIPSEHDRELYIVMEYCDTDLAAAIKAQSLRPVHRPYVLYQLLCALKYIHSASVVHRDVKPGNILINADCKMKLADFGYARAVGPPMPDALGPAENRLFGVGLLDVEKVTPVYTTYIGSRWYRAPEILLQTRRLTPAIDLWAVGCILAELISDVPLFPGTSTLHMVNLIAEVLGRPSTRDLTAIESSYKQLVFAGMSPYKPVDWAMKFLTTEYRLSNEESRDMLQMLLNWCPLRRLTAEECLNHPFVLRFSNPDSEVSVGATQKIRPTLDDNLNLRIGAWRDHLYEEAFGTERVKKVLQEERDKREQVLLEMEIVAEQAAQAEAENATRTARKMERRRLRAIMRGQALKEERKEAEAEVSDATKKLLVKGFMGAAKGTGKRENV